MPHRSFRWRESRQERLQHPSLIGRRKPFGRRSRSLKREGGRSERKEYSLGEYYDHYRCYWARQMSSGSNSLSLLPRFSYTQATPVHKLDTEALLSINTMRVSLLWRGGAVRPCLTCGSPRHSVSISSLFSSGVITSRSPRRQSLVSSSELSLRAVRAFLLPSPIL